MLTKVAQELHEPDVSWQVEFPDTTQHPQVGLEQRQQALCPILVDLPTRVFLPCVNFKTPPSGAMETRFGYNMRAEVVEVRTFLHQHTEEDIRQGVLHRDESGMPFITFQKKALQRCSTVQHPSIVPAVGRQ